MHDFSSRRGEFTARRRGGKQRFDDDEPTKAKRLRGRRALPPIEVFDATDGLPEGDRWSTWDQTDDLVPNVGTSRSWHAHRSHLPRLCLAACSWPVSRSVSH